MKDEPKNDIQDPKDEKRKHRRVGFYSHVRVSSVEKNAIDVQADNVSKGGIFLHTDQCLPKGLKVTLDFETEKGPVRIGEGEVCWRKEAEPESGNLSGIGIAFQTVQPESQNKIEAFIDEELEKENLAKIKTKKIQTLVIPDYKPPAVEKPAVKEPNEHLRISNRYRIGIMVGATLMLFLVGILIWLYPSYNSAAVQTKNQTKNQKVEKLPAGRQSETIPNQSIGTMKIDQPVVGKITATKPTQTSSSSYAEQKPEGKSTSDQIAIPEGEREISDGVRDSNLLHASRSIPSQISQPVFKMEKSKWKMVLHVDNTVHVDQLTMSNPPRLVLDISNKKWANHRKQRLPTPFVSQVRFGENLDVARLVLNFSGDKFPRFRIERLKKNLTIHFYLGAKVAPDENDRTTK